MADKAEMASQRASDGCTMLDLLFLLLATATPAEARCRPGLLEANAQLKLADKAVERRNFGGADAALDAALRAIGKRYASPTTNDDTGMHLVLADVQRRKGKLKQAITPKRRVLVERMELCEAG